MRAIIMTESTHNNSKLFYVMGASGVGKDSLLNFAREQLSAEESLVFAHRYITRPVELDGENHIALTNDEFSNRERLGCFAMHWGAHTNRYGIGIEIEQWLNKGINVVVNGSRGYFIEALEKYPNLKPILISAPKAILQQRLLKRGRETIEQVEKRLNRVDEYSSCNSDHIHTIENVSSIADAGQKLCHYIQHC